jgi:hypothetical protein
VNQLPKEIEKLNKRRKIEIDSALLEEFDQLVESKQKHLGTLLNLRTRMKQAELQLQHSLSSLATVDSQIRLIAAQDIDRSRSDGLRAEIQEQVNRLSDLIDSISEVYELE